MKKYKFLLIIIIIIILLTNDNEPFTSDKKIILTNSNKTCEEIGKSAVTEKDCLSRDNINKVKNIIKNDSRFKNINYGTIPEKNGSWNEVPKGCSFYVDPKSPEYNRVVWNKSNGPKYNISNVVNDKCKSGWCLPSSSHMICQEDDIILAKPEQTCDELGKIAVNEKSCLSADNINKVKNIIETDSRFKNINYGTVPEKNGSWNEVPKGCSFYVDPKSPEYNRVVWNKSNGPRYNISNVVNDKCKSGWCLPSSSYKLCINKPKKITLANPELTCEDINKKPVSEDNCINSDNIEEIKSIISSQPRFGNATYGTIPEQNGNWNEIPKGCSFYVDPKSPQYNRVVWNKSNGPVHNQSNVVNNKCKSGWCLPSSSYKMCQENTITLAKSHNTCSDIGLVPLNEQECLKKETIDEVKSLVKLQPKFRYVTYGTIPEQNGSWNEIPKGCSFYIDPNSPQYNRVVWNKSDGPKYNIADTPNNKCKSGWCLPSSSFKLCKKGKPHVKCNKNSNQSIVNMNDKTINLLL